MPFSLARDSEVNAPESTSQTYFAFIKNLAKLYYNCEGIFVLRILCELLSTSLYYAFTFQLLEKM